ncbi:MULTISPECIES: SOS response-associated peptidase [unclassified Rhodococcus (in: high G+C Gram-positive bacteria)]|uniref:SOS response-associated peptidase n=1 Tax=unclassified Rhodococcus (in: high G+C Gram-positive bacteria) TaxID=192944 RepID=UPI002955A08C|nr:SOS response-associated peptidase [Rhodococcus sp. IEGM 1318]MDV8003917.1 SOS response-associated peptidase [Rhodococcus sp. IEGM 1318]MDZ7912226.1 SOS response-associated peptidase [Rhodococcus sp. (in: high G+C Gram-positive bacteria)]
MCGRYATTADPATLAVELDALDETDHSAPVEADYNVAPTTEVLTVVKRHDRENPDSDPTKRIRRMRWGLVPSWTKELGKGPVLFNARADSLAEKPAFRTAFKFKRCLVPMDGWYEWQTEATGGKKAAKIPYYMHPDDGSRLFMAGVWSAWRDPKVENASPVLSCSIVTVDSLGHLEQVHDRMPLALPRDRWEAWLDPDNTVDSALLEPVSDLVERIDIDRVRPMVNSVKNNGHELIEPDVDRAGEQISLL